VDPQLGADKRHVHTAGELHTAEGPHTAGGPHTAAEVHTAAEQHTDPTSCRLTGQAAGAGVPGAVQLGDTGDRRADCATMHGAWTRAA
jgi:hypothetical protein